jgi:hypothetical protein
MIGIVHSEDGAIADHNLAARVDQLVAGRRGNCATTWTCGGHSSAGANHSYRVPVKLIDCRAHLAQDIVQLLLFLPPHGNLDEWNDSHREYGHDGYRHDELDERKPVLRI